MHLFLRCFFIYMLTPMKTLKCIAFEHKDRGDIFIAYCLDLSLRVEALTMIEAIDELYLKIRNYLDELHISPTLARELLDQRAPITIWVKYFLAVFKSAFGLHRKDVRIFYEFYDFNPYLRG